MIFTGALIAEGSGRHKQRNLSLQYLIHKPGLPVNVPLAASGPGKDACGVCLREWGKARALRKKRQAVATEDHLGGKCVWNATFGQVFVPVPSLAIPALPPSSFEC